MQKLQHITTQISAQFLTFTKMIYNKSFVDIAKKSRNYSPTHKITSKFLFSDFCEFYPLTYTRWTERATYLINQELDVSTVAHVVPEYLNLTSWRHNMTLAQHRK